MKAVLITGGAGFIGAHLCRFLLSKGCKVICLDSLLTGRKKNIKELLRNKNFVFKKHDITISIKLKEKIDYVLHFASPASPVFYLNYPIKTLKVNSLGTHNALGIAKNKKAVFLLASTSEIYGDPLVHPQPETYWGNVNCLGPRGVYDESKRFAEAITIAYHKKHKLNVKICRIFNTYGPMMRSDDGRVIPNFIKQASSDKPLTIFGSGKQTRSFCYIEDLVRAIYAFMCSGETGPFNLGSTREMNMLELAKLIIRLTDSKSRISFKKLPIDDPKIRRPDITLAGRRLKWRPTVELEEGLLRTISWFNKDK
ncbi:MAG: SDR family oxidoreductase [Candidatus Omnitrophica bacterium]|nr:SDR family oxidoreductase [Candidatus Omnitrophota bacterium]